MCSQSEIRSILQAIRCEAVRQFGEKLDVVILYGSYARGDYDAESDVDVMVRVRMGQKELSRYRWGFSELASDLGMEYNVFVSISLQDSELFDRYKEILELYQNIDREGIEIS